MKTSGFSYLGILFLFLCVTSVTCRKGPKEWEGVLVFKDNFDGFDLRRDYWEYDDSCQGKGHRDDNLECFAKSDKNVQVSNGSLIITAVQEPWSQMKLWAKPKNFTSGRVRAKGPGYTHGTFVIRARMPYAKHLLPTILLLPAYQDHDNCKYEEIDIVQARGQKPSNLVFAAHFGRRWNSVVTKTKERSFPGTDFSKDFHEFALVWKPLRMDWYVDKELVYTASTHFYTDWLLNDESNLPCNGNKNLFKQPLQLAFSMSIGGASMFPEVKYGNLTIEESQEWPKPTFEIDWVRVYQF